MKSKTTVKINKLIIFMVVFFFAFIIGRLIYISMSDKVDGINLHNFANNRNTKNEVIYANRGNIYDKDGNTLASTINSYKLIAYLDARRTTNPKKPQHVVDKVETAKVLAKVLEDHGMTYEIAFERLSKTGLYQVEFGKEGSNISESKKNEIEALKLPGIDFINGKKRTYSMGSFASYIIGYAKTEEDGNIKGELGIESYYNKELSGTDGKTTYQTDAYGYTLPSAEVITEDAIDGSDIYLTIDTNIQRLAEMFTNSMKEKYTMDWMVFTVMDAKTGAIVASSTYPNFNPNKLDITNYLNPLVSNEYEPGSTMKIFSFATAIENGKYNGNELYDSGKIEVANAIIKDFNSGHGWGKITYDTGFAYSSNVAATKIGLNLGVSTLTDYYKRLGFGKKTGIELANESKGIINFQYKTELANAAFGQGITVTPVQMLQGFSALTNDGVALKPYIVQKIVNDAGEETYTGGRTEIGKVYSKETMDYMKKLMHNVVYEGLESSKRWQPSKTTIIGKTGTAQIASSKGGYLKGNYDYVRSFVGIFPEENPKYIAYVAVKQINTTAAGIAKEYTKTIDDIVSYLGLVNNTEEIIKKSEIINNYISNETVTTVEELKNKKLSVITLGTGKYVINQYPIKGTKVLEGSKVFIVTNNSDYVMADLTGWSLNEVMSYINLLGLEVNINGYGKVTSQNIEPGTTINNDTILEVTLSK